MVEYLLQNASKECNIAVHAFMLCGGIKKNLMQHKITELEGKYTL